jgi:hypothetical protein
VGEGSRVGAGLQVLLEVGPLEALVRVRVRDGVRVGVRDTVMVSGPTRNPNP